MTDETKKLFDVPWYVFSSTYDEITVIENESGRVLAELDDVKTANCLSHLPELYDALKEAAYEFCHNCVTMTSDSEYVPDSDDFIENNCPKKSKECFCRKWWTLLKKVRDGE